MSRNNSDFYINIGSRIREIRIQQGLTQSDLAERAHLSAPVVSEIENARSKIWLETFAKIIEALHVSADDVLRLNTPQSSAGYPAEVKELLDGCTSSETEAIIRIIKQVKSAFENQKKEYLE